MKNFILLASLCSVLMSNSASATGYEKTVLTSGKFGGMAGASVSAVNSSESLYLNPAGLAGMNRPEVMLSLSPFLIKKAGQIKNPIAKPNTGSQVEWGENLYILPGGLYLGVPLAKGFGVALGYYASAGGGGKLGNADYGTTFSHLHPEVNALIQFTELSLGAGLEILPGLKLGASWRMVFVNGFYKFGAALDVTGDQYPDALYAINLDNLTDIKLNAFKFGAQYNAPSNRWGLGTTLRTGITFNAEGDSSYQGQVANAASAGPVINTGHVTVISALPWQLAVGGHFDLTSDLRLAAEYSFTHYAGNRATTFSGNPIGGVGPSAFNSYQEWMNMHGARIGADYKVSKASSLRAGYAHMSQVTRNNHANFLSMPPAAAHTVTLGAGTNLCNDSLGLDGALDYSWFNSAEGINSRGTGFLDGKYELWALSVHMSASYRF